MTRRLTHDHDPAHACEQCERAIERAKDRRDDTFMDDGQIQDAENNYERHLDRMGGSA